ncbi:MAG TPA: 4-oxalocrotonate tautomerase [Acidimicrobiia bacterium]|nr:4-oxalocrotonate tautomerase [Acidimicrobiia bacterium]
MPLIELTHSKGALPEAAVESLVDRLTAAVLRAERAPDTETARAVTWVQIRELDDRASWSAGRPVEEPVFRLAATVPAGVLSPRRKEEFVAEATAAVRASVENDLDPMRVWIIVTEVPEGNWGAGGTLVTLERLRALVTPRGES